MLKYLLCLGALLLPTTATAAEDWWFAESDHFRVYSSGGEPAAKKMAVELERVDQAMRLFTGVAQDEDPLPDSSKPTVFQFGETSDIGRLAGQDGVAGFFIAGAGNSVAFVPLAQGRSSRSRASPGARTGFDLFDYDIPPQVVLFHEYAHYFMYQHAPAAYPIWYREGLAELFGSLKIGERGFSLGEPPEHRKGEIAMVDVDLDQIFVKDERNSRSINYPYYGHGWLLTSYLSFAPERAGQLAEFLRSLNAGVATPDAAKSAFGDLGSLEKELNAYRRQQARGMQVQFPQLEEPEVELRELSPAQAARMDVYIHSAKGVNSSEARSIVSDARELLARHPNDPAVMRAALEAEFDAGNMEQVSALAKGLLDTEYAVDANIYLARRAMEYAKKDKAWLARARAYYAAANRLNPEEPNALRGYYLTHRLSGSEPPEDALIALESAYALAPFDSEVRTLLAHLLLLENRDATALSLLNPVINQPHGGKEASRLRDLVEKFEAGEREPLIEELAPSLEEKKT